VQWPALREYDDDAYDAEGEEEGYCGFAGAFEGFFDSYHPIISHTRRTREKSRTDAQVEEYDRGFDRVDANIVYALNSVRHFETGDCLLQRDFCKTESHLVVSQDVYSGEVAECEEQSDDHRVIIFANVVQYDGACVYPQTDDSDCQPVSIV
jgi:hypothetical protein